MKKHFALLTALVLSFGMFTACGGQNSTPASSGGASSTKASGGDASTAISAPAEIENFNPDEADGMEFKEMRSQFGAVPMPEGTIQFGRLPNLLKTSIGAP